MAYNSSGYYQSDDLGEYHQTPYAFNSGLDFVTGNQDSVAYSNYKDPSFYNLFDYDIPTPYNYRENYDNNFSYNHNPTWSTTTAYSSIFTPTEPKSIQYHPNSYHMIAHDHRPQTQFVISYSVSEFNIPNFDEYDPTPYGGGYDIAQTYGKPIPPSAETCYPHSGSEIKPPSFNGEANGKEKTEPQKGIKPAEAPKEEEQPHHEKNGHGGGVKPEEKRKQCTEEEERSTGGNGYEYERRVSQIPSGYGLEAMDLCESLFGYWPCLSRYARRSAINNGCHDSSNVYDESCGNQWIGAADYLFGSSDPYVERREGGGTYGLPIHCYERHYQEPPLFIQVESEEDSWSKNFKIF